MGSRKKSFVCYFSFTCELESHFSFGILNCVGDLRALPRRGCFNERPNGTPGLSLSVCLARNAPAERRPRPCHGSHADGHDALLTVTFPALPGDIPGSPR